MNIYSPKDRIPYVYEIQHKKSLKKYIGVRFGKGCHPDELLKEYGYKTSSKVVNKIIKEEGLNSFQILNIETFQNKEEAVEREIELLKSVEANRNREYYNKGIGKAIVWDDEMKKNCLEKHGKQYYMETQEFRKRIKQTNLLKYGFENPFQVEEFKEKIKETNLSKYGVEHVSKSKEFQERKKVGMLEKTGFEHQFHNPETWEKTRKTLMDKFGVTHSWSTENARKNASKMMSGLSDKIFECRYCGKTVKGAGLFKRWHDERCKENPDQTMYLEARKKTSEHMKRLATFKGECQHCKKLFRLSILKTYHGDNCVMNPNKI